MSLGARATKGGAKTAARDGKHSVEKKTEKPQPKEKVKPQATTEQLRMAHMIDRKNDDASDVRRMVLELMEMTCRTEEEVCSALHDADNDMQAACNLLLEETTRIQGEWQTSEKKKKKPPAAVGNGEVEPPRDPRSRSGPRPRRGEGEGGARGRGAAGRGRGARGGGAGRGARRGAGSRAPPPPGARGWGAGAQGEAGGNMGDSFPTTEDWDNEEWSGSLSDTKVFTPSTQSQPPDTDHSAPVNVSNSAEDWDTPADTNNGLGSPHIPSYTYHGAERAPPGNGVGLGVGVSATMNPDLDSLHTPQPPLAHTVNIPMGMSGSLSAAQTQYLTQLTQQSQRLDNSVYTSNYGVYGSTDISNQRKPQRARVPPPSKIPSSAVEMPGGGEAGSASLIDVQFGALEPELTRDATETHTNKPQPLAPAVTSHPAPLQPPPQPELNSAYSTAATSMLNDSLQAVVDSAPSSQPVAPEPTVANTSSLEKQLTSGMKQLSVSPAALTTQQYTQHRPKTVGQQNVYASHHAVSHHPQVYGANVYASPVNSTVAASLSGQPAPMSAAAYPSSVTLSQYQPMINSYQQTSSSATVYGGAALYTAAPYTYQQPHNKLHKDSTQYDSSVASSNSLTNTSTTQTSTAKVTTTTAVTSASVAGAGAGGAAYAVQPSPAAALYGQAAAAAAAGGYPAYDEQYRAGTLPHHMGGYYEVGYGVSGAREGTFGLGAGERFGRADAASPQQVPAALPPGYAYFYQPPPTTYQYGVYPYGGGSSVGGVGGVSGGVAGKVSNYTQQQPPYEQDTYKAAGGYPGGGKATATGGGGAASELGNAMYANKHVALNKVNSYDKAQFHGGTPPPFGAGSHHLYIPAPPHHHHHHQLQQHQMDARVNSSQIRRESGGGGGAGGAGQGGRAASKPPNKPAYSQSYWPPN